MSSAVFCGLLFIFLNTSSKVIRKAKRKGLGRSLVVIGARICWDKALLKRKAPPTASGVGRAFAVEGSVYQKGDKKPPMTDAIGGHNSFKVKNLIPWSCSTKGMKTGACADGIFPSILIHHLRNSPGLPTALRRNRPVFSTPLPGEKGGLVFSRSQNEGPE
jgi:hypothetical protein